MMPWLRRFFYSDDPIVMVTGGLLEPERARDLLAPLLEDGSAGT